MINGRDSLLVSFSEIGTNALWARRKGVLTPLKNLTNSLLSVIKVNSDKLITQE